MLTIESVRLNYFKSQEDKELLDRAIPLIKEVFGYTDEEIEGFKAKIFYPPLAIDVTLEQAKLAIQPFVDHKITIYANEYDNNHNLIDSVMYSKKLGIVPQTPKSHYYDKPVIRGDQLIDPYNPPSWNSAWTTGYTFVSQPTTKPTVTCPYCQSTRCSRISILGRMVSVEFWGFASNKLGKQWHCHDCGSNF